MSGTDKLAELYDNYNKLDAAKDNIGQVWHELVVSDQVLIGHLSAIIIIIRQIQYLLINCHQLVMKLMFMSAV